MTIQQKIKLLPNKPGIYQYFDKNRRLLYVGKAKDLRKRVQSYFRENAKLSTRIRTMVNQIDTLEYLIVDSEHDALILENSLIKQLKPKYNILLRDDKTYPYIFINLNEKFPRFEITRKVIKGKNIKYFGPFSTSANEILKSIYNIYPLVQKKGSLKNKKACLFYEIKKCLAPCEGKIDEKSYKQIVSKAINSIEDRKKLIKELEKKMEFYSQNLLFEEAANIRDDIKKIKKGSILSHVDLAKLEDYDIFAIFIKDLIAIGIQLFIRRGKVISSSHSYFKSDNGFDKDELYKLLLMEYYQQQIPFIPKKILLYENFTDKETLKDFLQQKYSKNIDILIPKIGEKRKLTNLAYKNAQEILRINTSKDKFNILQEIKELFLLESIPFSIEGYDNSHMMGDATVGAIIKWNEKFIKKEYRHYNLTAKDEYSQMRELVTRRCESFDKNSPPDLMVIDGGETLLKLAIKIVKKSGANVDMIAISKEKKDLKTLRSKGKAKDIIYTKNGIFKLSTNDRRLHFIQNIRDESHRFAITFFKKQKLKKDKEIRLLNKKGVGEATVKKLLNYFESFENIEKASYEELKKVVGTNIARTIKNI